MARKTKTTDLTSDTGQKSALNSTWQEFIEYGDYTTAVTKSNLIGRGIAIRNLRLREKQFDRKQGK